MIVILTYHSISDKNYPYAISTDIFARQLLYIKKKFKIIRLADLENILKEGVQVENSLAVITFDDGLKDNYINALPILEKMNIPVTIFLVTKLVGNFIKSSDGTLLPLMTWNEIEEVKKSGLVDFQSHTHTHPILTQLKEKEVYSEFLYSKKIIKEKIGSESRYIAYPKGKFNDLIKKIATDYFALGFGGEGIVVDIKKIDKMSLPRLTIASNIPFWKFKFMLTPFYWRLKSIRNKPYK